ncbi:hypothetical protein AJ87_04470 [Rhizobium yanglingense]|nr:hypothetical protein AJ87_04470 [Rhizobium yanglingense]
METIVADGLPMGAYAFQQTLSNGSRPDCTVRMPNGAPPLVIDAKFPLEAWNAIRDAGTPDATKLASQQFRRDMEIHVRDISEKYLIQGETQETAFPSFLRNRSSLKFMRISSRSSTKRIVPASSLFRLRC